MPDAPPLTLTPENIARPMHSGVGVSTFLSLHETAAGIALGAGIALYGWRAAVAAAVVIGAGWFTARILQRVAWRGRQLRLWDCLWTATLLALMLPPHLITLGKLGGQSVWPILPAAGITGSLLTWLLGGIGAQRVQPAVASFLLIFVLFHEILTPPDINPPGDTLIAYTSAEAQPERASITMQMLLRDQMPPLENLIKRGPGTIAGGAAVIFGGLMLLYFGLIDPRIPVLGTLAATAALLILPIPAVITESGPQWHWFALRGHELGLAAGLTFVSYEIFSGPFLFMLFFLAGAPGLRPMTCRGRAVFAILLGFTAAAGQLYASVAIGAYLALLIVSLLTPSLDRLFPPRTLV